MWEWVKRYWTETFDLLNEMAPYLLLGFLIAGLLYVYFPKEKVRKYMGKGNFSSIMNAALIGIPLPLCSCGVIPTGVSFFKNGASKSSSVSFMISTPQTGIDSVLVTYSLLGLPFAIIRPIIALITGLIGGGLTQWFVRKNIPDQIAPLAVEDEKPSKRNLADGMKYAFGEFFRDIQKWLVIGILLAGLIAVVVPDDFFTSQISNTYIGILILLVASVPLYVCATSSVPIAAVLMMKGLSPGAALVFLMAGPATNIATMVIMGNVFGRRTLIAYMASIIGGAVIFGVLINEFLPISWFQQMLPGHDGGHDHHLLPYWLKVASSFILVGLVINGLVHNYRKKHKAKKQSGQTFDTFVMDGINIKVTGMTCSHCKANVEKNIANIEGIDEVTADPESNQVIVKGDHIDLNKIKSIVEGLGYHYEGKRK